MKISIRTTLAVTVMVVGFPVAAGATPSMDGALSGDGGPAGTNHMIEVAPNGAVIIVNGPDEQNDGIDVGTTDDVTVIVDNGPGVLDDAIDIAPNEALVIVSGPDDVELIDAVDLRDVPDPIDLFHLEAIDSYDVIDVSGAGVVIVETQS